MTTLYSIVLAIGTVALILWIVGVAAAAMVDAWASWDPDVRFGSTGRSVVAFVLGFGLAGMSSAFAGWATALTLVAAIVGGVMLVGVARWLGPEAASTGT